MAFYVDLFFCYKIVESTAKPFFKLHLWFPLQFFFCFGIGKGGAEDVAFAYVGIGWFQIFAGNVVEKSNEVIDADFCLGAKVIDIVDMRRLECCIDAAGNIAGIDEIPCLFTCAVNGDGQILSNAFGEDADYAAFAFIALAFPVDVGKTADDVFQTK